VLDYRLDNQGSRVQFPVWLRIFLFTTMSRMALGPTQLPIHWVPGALSMVVKWPGHEADHLPLSSAEIKEWVELYLYSPNAPSWCGAQLKKKHWDNFYPFTYTMLNTVQATARRRTCINSKHTGLSVPTITYSELEIFSHKQSKQTVACKVSIIIWCAHNTQYLDVRGMQSVG
jgi:hypothetical protein